MVTVADPWEGTREENRRGKKSRQAKLKKRKRKNWGPFLGQGLDLPLNNDSHNDNDDDNDTCSICYFPLSMHGKTKKNMKFLGMMFMILKVG